MADTPQQDRKAGLSRERQGGRYVTAYSPELALKICERIAEGGIAVGPSGVADISVGKDDNALCLVNCFLLDVQFVRVDRRIASPFPDRMLQRDPPVDRDTEVDDGEEKDEHDRQDERELDQRLAPRAFHTAKQLLNHDCGAQRQVAEKASLPLRSFQFQLRKDYTPSQRCCRSRCSWRCRRPSP